MDFSSSSSWSSTCPASTGKSALPSSGKSVARISPSHPNEGRLAIVTNVVWDAVDAERATDEVREADGEVVWSCNPVLSSFVGERKKRMTLKYLRDFPVPRRRRLVEGGPQWALVSGSTRSPRLWRRESGHGRRFAVECACGLRFLRHDEKALRDASRDLELPADAFEWFEQYLAGAWKETARSRKIAVVGAAHDFKSRLNQ